MSDYLGYDDRWEQAREDGGQRLALNIMGGTLGSLQGGALGAATGGYMGGGAKDIINAVAARGPSALRAPLNIAASIMPGVGSVTGLYHGAGEGLDLGSLAGDYINQKWSSDMSEGQQYYTAGFGVGAITRLKIAGINPMQFVQEAYQSQDPELVKIANAINSTLQLDNTKTAAANDIISMAQRTAAVYAGKLHKAAEQGYGERAQEMGQQAADKVRGMAGDVKQKFNGAASSVSNAMATAKGDASQIHHNLTDPGLIEKAKSMANGLTNSEVFDTLNPIEVMIENATKRRVLDRLQEIANENIGTNFELDPLSQRLQQNLLAGTSLG